MPDQGTIEAIERAKAYPFWQPSGSYLFTHHREHPLDGHPDGWELDLAELTPIFGYSSNPSPVALAHKFASITDVRIPVISLELDGFDAVYSGHVSSGYVPATILPSPGTTLNGFVTYLTRRELEIMDSSESRGENYELRTIAGVTGRFEDGTEIDTVTTYVGLHGHLEPDGTPVAVSGTSATGRRYPEMAQHQIADLARRAVAPDLTPDQFVAGALTSRARQRAWTEALKSSALHASPD